MEVGQTWCSMQIRWILIFQVMSLENESLFRLHPISCFWINLLISCFAMHHGGKSNIMFYANKINFDISGDVSREWVLLPAVKSSRRWLTWRHLCEVAISINCEAFFVCTLYISMLKTINIWNLNQFVYCICFWGRLGGYKKRIRFQNVILIFRGD